MKYENSKSGEFLEMAEQRKFWALTPVSKVPLTRKREKGGRLLFLVPCDAHDIYSGTLAPVVFVVFGQLKNIVRSPRSTIAPVSTGLRLLAHFPVI